MIKIFENFNKPKIIKRFWDNSQKESESWYLNGKRDGPAYQYWYKNGQKYYDWWYLKGKYHREDGPAFQSWSENGQKKHESWYLNNNIYYKREEWVEELKRIGSPHYEEQRMLLDMEKYNI